MILASLLSLFIASDLEQACTKWDGAQPTQCEMALAEGLYDCQLALQGGVIIVNELKAENERLRQALVSKPVAEEKNFTLLGLPSWLEISGGIVIGGALTALTIAIVD